MPQKHRKKKLQSANISNGNADVIAELPLGKKTEYLIFAEGGKSSVRSEILELISGFNDAALRRLGAQEIIPTPVKARWPLELTLKKLFAHLRSQVAATDSESRFEKLSFPSMEACEARTGIPKTFQQTAKEHGCTAFRDSRVYIGELLRWTFAQGTDGNITDWKQHGEKYSALNEEAKYKQTIGEFVSKTEFQNFIQSFAGICFSALKRWKQECPREWENRPKEFIKHSAETKMKAIISQTESKLESLKLAPPDEQ